MACFEVLGDLGRFARVADDSTYEVAVFDQAVDDVHALAGVGSYDQDGRSGREGVEVDDSVRVADLALNVYWRRRAGS
jgi:hypothetical protein